MHHPRFENLLITSSYDGYVRCFDSQNIAAAAINQKYNIVDSYYEDIFREPASFNCLDYDADSSFLMAGSSIGGLLHTVI
jgi:hypothetical protein